MVKRLYNLIKVWFNAFIYAKSKKVFCVGKNKTFTPSLSNLFKEMGLTIGPQRRAELLAKECAQNDYKRIIKYVKYHGTAFLDVPFNLTNTFKVLDKEFPDSKFILTISDSPEVWYETNTSYHSKLFGDGNLPTKSDLQKAKYVYPGWMWEMNRLIYKTPEDDIYNKTILIRQYNGYNNSVMEYFENKPGKLLVVNLEDEDALFRIRDFVNSN